MISSGSNSNRIAPICTELQYRINHNGSSQYVATPVAESDQSEDDPFAENPPLGDVTFALLGDDSRQPTPSPTTGEPAFTFGVHLISYLVFTDEAAAEAAWQAIIAAEFDDATPPPSANDTVLVRIANVILFTTSFLTHSSVDPVETNAQALMPAAIDHLARVAELAG